MTLLRVANFEQTEVEKLFIENLNDIVSINEEDVRSIIEEFNKIILGGELDINTDSRLITLNYIYAEVINKVQEKLKRILLENGFFKDPNKDENVPGFGVLTSYERSFISKFSGEIYSLDYFYTLTNKLRSNTDYTIIKNANKIEPFIANELSRKDEETFKKLYLNTLMIYTTSDYEIDEKIFNAVNDRFFNFIKEKMNSLDEIESLLEA